MKGWTTENCILPRKWCNSAIHVHQTSPEALEGEAVVKEQLHEYSSSYGQGYIATLPAHLIGKRVRWIIEVIEEG